MSAVALAVGAGVAGVAGMAGSMMGANANASAMDKASQIQSQQYTETKNALNQGKTEALGYIDPYAKTGRSALDALSYGMGLSGGTPNAWDIPTNTKVGQSNDPIWDYVLQQNLSGGGKIKGNLTDPENAGLLKQLQSQYTNLSQQAGAASGANAGVGQGSLSNYGQEQYKQDVGYTPMVNSLAELQATPGYQFQLEQGLQGVNNSAAARGGLLSGANMKAINNYAQGQAATGYQGAWDRAQSAYQNAFGRNQQKFTNLQSMANNGQTAAANQGQASLSVGTGLAGASTAYGNNQSNLSLAQGQNQANMYTGIGNAVGGMASSLSGLYAGSGGSGGSGGGGGGGNAANLRSGGTGSWNVGNYAGSNGLGGTGAYI